MKTHNNIAEQPFLQHLEQVERHKKILWETRKSAVNYFLQGRDAAWIAKQTGVQPRTVSEWIRRYEAGGLESLRPYQHGSKVPAQAATRPVASAAGAAPMSPEEPQPARHSLLRQRLTFLRQLFLEPR